MKSTISFNRALMCLTMMTFTVALLALACASTDDPFNIDERARKAETITTPSPGSTPAPQSTLPPEEMARKAEEAEKQHLESLFEESIGAIRIGEWKDNNTRQLLNYLAAYIMVYGYGYSAELVDTTDDEYRDALTKGDLDVVIETPQEWIEEQAQSGLVVDAGGVKDADPTSRIGVYGAINQNSPEIMEFLSRYTPGDEKIAELAKKITGGRVGVKANVAALTYLKNNQDTWARWMPATVVDKVDAAIKAGKTSLLNRKCIPGGGSGAGEPNCGT